MTDPLSHTTSYTYTADSQVASVTDGMGAVTSYAYDNLGREVSRTDPVPATGIAAPVTTYGYDAASQLTSTTDPLGNVTSNAFDHAGRLISTTDAMSQTTSFGYDAASNQTSRTDALGNTTTTAFNADNQVISVTAPVPATGLSAPVTSYTYDHLGRETSVTDPTGAVTSYQYDASSNLTSVTDPNSNTTSYTLDNLNRVTQTTDANGHTVSDSYDALGHVTSQTDKNGRVTNYSFDNLGRLTQEQWMSGGTAIYTANWAYDAAGNLTSASDNNSAYAYTYNADNSVTQVDNSGTPTGPHVVLNIGYDNLQRETSLSATVAGTLDFLNNYSYDAASNVTQVTQQSQTGGNSVAPKVVNLTYSADAQYATISRYANLAATQLVATSTFGYDANGNMTSLSQDKGATNLNSSAWSYDHLGRVTGGTSIDGTDGFTYDAAGQLTAATHSYQANESYSFDATGNRTNTGYTTGTNNQLSSDGTYNYLYDNEGNLTKKTTIATGAYVTYTWDYHNRLTDVQAYNSSNVLQSHEHYTYDVFDRLIERQVDPTGGGTYTTTQSFVYDNSGNVVLVYNGSGTLTDRLLNGPGVNNTLADENGSGTVSWLLADNEGTIRDVVQYNSGTNTTSIVDHLEYNSFGVITSQSNSAYQPLFAYTGQMWDAAAGLYYYHARWYDASAGRFISQDPTGFAAGDANLYRYVQNNPMNFVDPTGLDSEELRRARLEAAKEMARAGLKKAEIDFRLKILENVSTGRVAFGDGRDPRFWTENADGVYIPGGTEKVDPDVAIKMLWEPRKDGETNKIYCYKYSKLILMKTHMDVADAAKLATWNAAMRGKIIPNEIDAKLMAEFVMNSDNRKQGNGFGPQDLRAGDQIWLINPYHAAAVADLRLRIRNAVNTDVKLELQAKLKKMSGEQGSNVFWAGDGKVLGIYARKQWTIINYRMQMLNYESTKYASEVLRKNTKVEDFEILQVNRPAIPGK